MPAERGASSRSDRVRDHGDTARDHGDTARDHLDEQGDSPSAARSDEQKRFAKNYPDPFGDGQLQVWPLKKLSDFKSINDFFIWLEAFDRWSMGKPPPRPVPETGKYEARVPSSAAGTAVRPPHRSRQIGVRLTERDYRLLTELARAHSVRPGTMAQMLVARGVRAAAETTAAEG